MLFPSPLKNKRVKHRAWGIEMAQYLPQLGKSSRGTLGSVDGVVIWYSVKHARLVECAGKYERILGDILSRG